MSEKWFSDYDSCIECGTTERKHHGHGLCVNCYARWNRKQNLEAKRAYNKEYEKRPHRKEYIEKWKKSEAGKTTIKKGSDKYREKNREIMLERTRKWRDKNRDKIKEYNDSQRDKKWRRRYGYDALILLRECDYKCQKCGSGERPCIHHIDWDESNNIYDNFSALCGSCHSKLHSWVPKRLRKELFLEWMETQ